MDRRWCAGSGEHIPARGESQRAGAASGTGPGEAFGVTRRKLQAMPRPTAGRPGASAQPPVRVRRSGGRRRPRWVLAALLVPVLFTVVIAVGVFLMWHRQMSFFRPPPVGLLQERAPPVSQAGPVRIPANA